MGTLDFVLAKMSFVAKNFWGSIVHNSIPYDSIVCGVVGTGITLAAYTYVQKRIRQVRQTEKDIQFHFRMQVKEFFKQCETLENIACIDTSIDRNDAEFKLVSRSPTCSKKMTDVLEVSMRNSTYFFRFPELCVYMTRTSRYKTRQRVYKEKMFVVETAEPLVDFVRVLRHVDEKWSHNSQLQFDFYKTLFATISKPNVK